MGRSAFGSSEATIATSEDSSSAASVAVSSKSGSYSSYDGCVASLKSRFLRGVLIFDDLKL